MKSLSAIYENDLAGDACVFTSLVTFVFHFIGSYVAFSLLALSVFLKKN